VASGVVFRDSRIRGNLIKLLILLLLLLALLFTYYILTRPPQIAGDGAPPEDENFQFLYSIYGFEGDLLSRPSGVSIGPDDRIYVADTSKHRLVVFDIQGRYVSSISGSDLGAYSFRYPVSVAVAQDGRVYVLSRQDRKIVIFNRDFEPLDTIEFPDLIPTYVYVQGETLYVVTDKAIMLGTLDGGAPIAQVGVFGKGPGQFDLPGGLAVDPETKTLYVADTLNYRVQAIDEETGEPRWVYGEPIPAGEAIRYRGPTRMFGLPASIALDEMGLLYVVDGTNSEIVVLDAQEGRLIRTLGEIGHADGRFYYPDGIAYGEGGYIAVADKFNDRVMVFRVPAPAPDFLAARWLPLLLLPLLALVLWLLLRRRTKFVASPDFITEVIEGDYVDDLAGYTKKLYVTPATFAMFEEAFEKPELIKTEPDEKRLDEIRDAFDLDETLVEVVALVHQLKGKKALLTEAEPARDAAEVLEITYLNLAELIEQGEIVEKDFESEVEK